MDNDSKLFEQFCAEESLAPPALPELRTFVVRRYDPLFVNRGDRIEEIFVTAHYAEYGQGGVLILMAYVFDNVLAMPVTRTVRAFASWLDVELVPALAKSALAH